jgi:hypothetical protein
MSTRGIPQTYWKDYEEFRTDKEPLKLHNELARLRTFCVMSGEMIEKELQFQQENDDKNFGKLLAMMGEVRNTIEAISRVAERCKKIEEGLIVKIDFSGVTKTIQQFLRDVVLTVVLDNIVRQNILLKSEQFFLKLSGKSERNVIDMAEVLCDEVVNEDGEILYLPMPPGKKGE